MSKVESIIHIELYRDPKKKRTTILMGNEFNDYQFSLSDEVFSELAKRQKEIEKDMSIEYFWEGSVIIRR